MSFWYAIFWSSLGRKIITSIAGLGLYLYLVIHLGGNLTLLTRNPAIFNGYAHFLKSLGWLLLFLEAVLLAGFVFHIVYSSAVWVNRLEDRPQHYKKRKDVGSPSHKTLSSKTMIWTGIIILIFLVMHIRTFKYGPGIDQGYVTVVNGVRMRDLYRLTIETFTNVWWVVWYSIVMILLGFHLRHAFWSAFQSLGTSNRFLTPILFTASLILALLLAAGFLFIPIFIYFTGGPK